MTDKLQVTREDAWHFLERATRNWAGIEPLTADDIADVAGALQDFAARHRISAEQRIVEWLREPPRNLLGNATGHSDLYDARTMTPEGTLAEVRMVLRWFADAIAAGDHREKEV